MDVYARPLMELKSKRNDGDYVAVCPQVRVTYDPVMNGSSKFIGLERLYSK